MVHRSNSSQHLEKETEDSTTKSPTATEESPSSATTSIASSSSSLSTTPSPTTISCGQSAQSHSALTTLPILLNGLELRRNSTAAAITTTTVAINDQHENEKNRLRRSSLRRSRNLIVPLKRTETASETSLNGNRAGFRNDNNPVGEKEIEECKNKMEVSEGVEVIKTSHDGDDEDDDNDSDVDDDIKGQLEERSILKINTTHIKSINCSLPLERISNILEKLNLKPKTSGEIVPGSSLTVSTTSPSKILCLYCDRSFSNQKLCEKHAERVHLVVKGRRLSSRNSFSAGSVEYPGCSFCCAGKNLSLLTGNLDGLFSHLMVTHSDKYFACKLCMIRYSNFDQLAEHSIEFHKIKMTPPQMLTSTVTSVAPTSPLNIDINVKELSVSLMSTIPKFDSAENTKEGSTVEEVNEDEDGIQRRLRRSSSARKKRQLLKNEELILTRLGVTQNRSPRTLKGAKNRRGTRSTDRPNFEITTKNLRSKNARSAIALLPPIIGLNDTPETIVPAAKTALTVKNVVETSTAVYDDDFYETVSQNVRQNLSCHIDGKLEGSPTAPSPLSPVAAEPPVQSTVVRSPHVTNITENEIHEATTLTATTAFPTLLTADQYGSEPVTAKIKKTFTKNSWKWKWDFIKKYKYVNEGGKIVKKVKQQTSGFRDLSQLDMWTQLTMRTKHELTRRWTSNEYDDIVTNTDSEILPQVSAVNQSGREEKRKQIEQLNTILDSRLLPQINIEQNEQRLIKQDPDEDEITDIKTNTLEELSSAEKEDIFTSILKLQKNLDTNRSRRPNVILSGEWARPRCYVCFGCGERFETLKILEEHKHLHHPHVYSTHYEIVGRELIERELYRHFYIPSRALLRHIEYFRKHRMTDEAKVNEQRIIEVEDSMDSVTESSSAATKSELCDDTDTNSKVTASSTSSNGSVTINKEVVKCTKCARNCNGMIDLYRHMLDCAGDYAWLIAKKRLRYRYFGNRSRRRRGPHNRQNFPKRSSKKSTTHINTDEDGSTASERKETPQTPRSKPSDAESIQRMLANLPPKRCCRQIMPTSKKPVRKIVTGITLKTRNGANAKKLHHHQFQRITRTSIKAGHGKITRNLSIMKQARRVLRGKKCLNKPDTKITEKVEEHESDKADVTKCNEDIKTTDDLNDNKNETLLKIVKKKAKNVVKKITRTFNGRSRLLRSTPADEMIEAKVEENKTDTNIEIEEKKTTVIENDNDNKITEKSESSGTQKIKTLRNFRFRKTKQHDLKENENINVTEFVENDKSTLIITNTIFSEKFGEIKNSLENIEIEPNLPVIHSAPPKMTTVDNVNNDEETRSSTSSQSTERKRRGRQQIPKVQTFTQENNEISVSEIENAHKNYETINEDVPVSTFKNNENKNKSFGEIKIVIDEVNVSQSPEIKNPESSDTTFSPNQLPVPATTTLSLNSISPPCKRKPKKLNDCIAMLTGKLQQKLGIPFLDVAESVEEQPNVCKENNENVVLPNTFEITENNKKPAIVLETIELVKDIVEPQINPPLPPESSQTITTPIASNQSFQENPIDDDSPLDLSMSNRNQKEILVDTCSDSPINLVVKQPQQQTSPKPQPSSSSQLANQPISRKCLPFSIRKSIDSIDIIPINSLMSRSLPPNLSIVPIEKDRRFETNQQDKMVLSSLSSQLTITKVTLPLEPNQEIQREEMDSAALLSSLPNLEVKEYRMPKPNIAIPITSPSSSVEITPYKKSPDGRKTNNPIQMGDKHVLGSLPQFNQSNSLLQLQHGYDYGDQTSPVKKRRRSKKQTQQQPTRIQQPFVMSQNIPSHQQMNPQLHNQLQMLPLPSMVLNYPLLPSIVEQVMMHPRLENVNIYQPHPNDLSPVVQNIPPEELISEPIIGSLIEPPKKRGRKKQTPQLFIPSPRLVEDCVGNVEPILSLNDSNKSEKSIENEIPTIISTPIQQLTAYSPIVTQKVDVEQISTPKSTIDIPSPSISVNEIQTKVPETVITEDNSPSPKQSECISPQVSSVTKGKRGRPKKTENDFTAFSVDKILGVESFQELKKSIENETNIIPVEETSGNVESHTLPENTATETTKDSTKMIEYTLVETDNNIEKPLPQNIDIPTTCVDKISMESVATTVDENVVEKPPEKIIEMQSLSKENNDSLQAKTCNITEVKLNPAEETKSVTPKKGKGRKTKNATEPKQNNENVLVNKTDEILITVIADTEITEKVSEAPSSDDKTIHALPSQTDLECSDTVNKTKESAILEKTKKVIGRGRGRSTVSKITVKNDEKSSVIEPNASKPEDTENTVENVSTSNILNKDEENDKITPSTSVEEEKKDTENKKETVLPENTKAPVVSKPRKRRQNELSAIIADQLLESFKEVDKSRIDELKLLHELSLESTNDDILLNAVQDVPKRKVAIKSFNEKDLIQSATMKVLSKTTKKVVEKNEDVKTKEKESDTEKIAKKNKEKDLKKKEKIAESKDKHVIASTGKESEKEIESLISTTKIENSAEKEKLKGKETKQNSVDDSLKEKPSEILNKVVTENDRTKPVKKNKKKIKETNNKEKNLTETTTESNPEIDKRDQIGPTKKSKKMDKPSASKDIILEARAEESVCINEENTKNLENQMEPQENTLDKTITSTVDNAVGEKEVKVDVKKLLDKKIDSVGKPLKKNKKEERLKASKQKSLAETSIESTSDSEQTPVKKSNKKEYTLQLETSKESTSESEQTPIKKLNKKESTTPLETGKESTSESERTPIKKTNKNESTLLILKSNESTSESERSPIKKSNKKESTLKLETSKESISEGERTPIKKSNKKESTLQLERSKESTSESERTPIKKSNKKGSIEIEPINPNKTYENKSLKNDITADPTASESESSPKRRSARLITTANPDAIEKETSDPVKSVTKNNETAEVISTDMKVTPSKLSSPAIKQKSKKKKFSSKTAVTDLNLTSTILPRMEELSLGEPLETTEKRQNPPNIFLNLDLPKDSLTPTSDKDRESFYKTFDPDFDQSSRNKTPKLRKSKLGEVLAAVANKAGNDTSTSLSSNSSIFTSSLSLSNISKDSVIETPNIIEQVRTSPRKTKEIESVSTIEIENKKGAKKVSKRNIDDKTSDTKTNKKISKRRTTINTEISDPNDKTLEKSFEIINTSTPIKTRKIGAQRRSTIIEVVPISKDLEKSTETRVSPKNIDRNRRATISVTKIPIDNAEIQSVVPSSDSSDDDDVCLATIAKTIKTTKKDQLEEDEFSNCSDTPAIDDKIIDLVLPIDENKMETISMAILAGTSKGVRNVEFNLDKNTSLAADDIVDDNTNTELLDMDMDDDMSVYTTHSIDTTVTVGGTRIRKRRYRKSILLKSRKSKQKTFDLEGIEYKCELCKKVFRKPDALAKHKMTLMHIAKLSEQEFIDFNKKKETEKNDELSKVDNQISSHPIIEKLPSVFAQAQPTSILLSPGIEPISSPELADMNYDRYSVGQMRHPSGVVPSNNPIEKSRLSMSQEEKLFFECCNMLKGSEVNTTTKPQQVGEISSSNKSNSVVYSVKSPMLHSRSSPTPGIPKVDLNQFSDISSDSNQAYGTTIGRPIPDVSTIFPRPSSQHNKTDVVGGFFSSAEKYLNGSLVMGGATEFKVASSPKQSPKPNQPLMTVSGGQSTKDSSMIIGSYSDIMSDMGDSYPSSQDASESENYAQTIMDRNQPTLKKKNDDIEKKHEDGEFTKLPEDKVDEAGSPFESPVHSTSSQSSTMSKLVTKGALKGYDNFKVSIPTIGLDLEQALVRGGSQNASKLNALAEIALCGKSEPPCEERTAEKIPSIAQLVSIETMVDKPAVVSINKIDEAEKKLGTKIKSSRGKKITPPKKVGNRLGFKAKKNLKANTAVKNQASTSSECGGFIEDNSKKEHDIYEFEDSCDSADAPIIPLSKAGAFRGKILTKEMVELAEKVTSKSLVKNLLAATNEESQTSQTSFSDRDDFQYGASSSGTDNGSDADDNANDRDKDEKKGGQLDDDDHSDNDLSLNKLPDNNNLQKKFLIMGRIFKNAKKAQSASPTQTTGSEVQNDGKKIEKPKKLPKQELDKLFDSLKGNETRADKVACEGAEHEIEKEDESESASGVRSKESLRRDKKSKKSREIQMLEAEWGMSLEQIKEIIGVGQRKSQRKCAVGKQKILAETWSSDEYEDFHTTKDIIALIQETEIRALQRRNRNSLRNKKEEKDAEEETNEKSEHQEEVKPVANDTNVTVDDSKENDKEDRIPAKENISSNLKTAEKKISISEAVEDKDPTTDITEDANLVQNTPLIRGESKSTTNKVTTDKTGVTPKPKPQRRRSTAAAKSRLVYYDSESDFEADWNRSSRRSKLKKRRKTTAFREINTRDQSKSKTAKNQQIESDEQDGNHFATVSDKEIVETEKIVSKEKKTKESDGKKAKCKSKNKKIPMSRRKRIASEMLYYWSSSSDDEEFGRVKTAREGESDDDDGLSQDGEHLQQHGWIVGDSHKKLVTLLAHAKGKMSDDCGVKETGSKKKL